MMQFGHTNTYKPNNMKTNTSAYPRPETNADLGLSFRVELQMENNYTSFSVICTQFSLYKEYVYRLLWERLPVDKNYKLGLWKEELKRELVDLVYASSQLRHWKSRLS